MNEPLLWEILRIEACALEIRIHESNGYVFLLQCGSGQRGTFEENLAGWLAAGVWLAEIRHAIEVRDHLRSLEPPRRRRMSLRYLWRRSGTLSP
jgi:hypothetical protein